MTQKITVPAIVGAVLTALAGVLAAAATIPAAAFYATLGVAVVNTIIPLFDYAPGLTSFHVPAYVGVVLTTISGVLVTLESVPAVALYATAAASMVTAVVPLLRCNPALKRRYGAVDAALPMSPKVKAPAYIGLVITVALSVVSALSGIPAVAPYVAGVLTFLHTVAGWFAVSGEAAA